MVENATSMPRRGLRPSRPVGEAHSSSTLAYHPIPPLVSCALIIHHRYRIRRTHDESLALTLLVDCTVATYSLTSRRVTTQHSRLEIRHIARTLTPRSPDQVASLWRLSFDLRAYTLCIIISGRSPHHGSVTIQEVEPDAFQGVIRVRPRRLARQHHHLCSIRLHPRRVFLLHQWWVTRR